MTADVSPDAPCPPSGIRDPGGPMPFNEADFTRDVRELVAEGDRVPKQRQDGCVMTMTLTDFLLARIAEDEAFAWQTARPPSLRHIVWADTHSTIAERIVAECAAKRRIVALHSEDEGGGGLHLCHDSLADETECGELRALASVYADHPDFP